MSENAPENEGPEEGTGTEENEGTEEGTQEYTAPEQAEWEKTTKALARVKTERTKARQELAQLREQLEKQNGGKDDKPAETKPDPELRVKTVAVTSALVGAGLTRAQAKKVSRLVDLSEVEVDPDGDADLDEVIEDLKGEFPGLFAGAEAGSKANARPRTAGGRSKDAGNTRTPDQKNSDALLRAAGYR